MGVGAQEIALFAVGFFVAALMMPLGLQAIATANMTGVNANVATIFTILMPVLAIIGLAVKFIGEIRS